VANEAVAVAAAAATVVATVAVAPAAEAPDFCRAWLQRLQHCWHSAAKIVADVADGAADLSADCGPSVAGRARQYHWDWNGPILPNRQHLVLLQDDVEVAAAAVVAADDIAVAAVAVHPAAASLFAASADYDADCAMDLAAVEAVADDASVGKTAEMVSR